MRLFVIHRFQRGTCEITVRLNQRGEASVREATLDGRPISLTETRVDPIRAQRLVEQAFRYAPMVPHVGGDVSFGIGRGDQQPEVRSCSAEQLPPELTVLAHQLESLAKYVVQNGRSVALASAQPPSSARPEVSPRFDRGSFLAWTAVFFCAHFLAVGVGSLFAFAATELVGAAATVSALMGILLAGAVAHGGLGSLVGRAFGDRAPAWGPSLAAVVAFLSISWLAVGAPGVSELITLAFPVFATLGQILRVRAGGTRSVDSSMSVPNLAT